MAWVVSVTNQKGGVGKTTTALSLSCALALKKKKILLLDMDPQANASSGLSLSGANNMYKALISKELRAEEIRGSKIEGLNIVPANRDLAGAELELAGETDRVFFLSTLLKKWKEHYDYIFIDTPPSLGILTLNALVASQGFLVPLQCEYYALEGLSQLLNTAREVRQRWNYGLNFQGIVLTMFDCRNTLSYKVEQEVRNHFGKLVFKKSIPRNVRLSEAPSFGKTIFQYSPHCLGAMAYEQLAEEFLQRCLGQEKLLFKEGKKESLQRSVPEGVEHTALS